MKYQFVLLFCLIYSLPVKSQKYIDTVITKSDDTIICKITLINDVNIFYSYPVKKGEKHVYISLEEVKKYKWESQYIKPLIQDTIQSSYPVKKSIGVKAGAGFSKFIQGSPNYFGGLGSQTTWDIKYNNNYSTGFNMSGYFESDFSKRISFQTELRYVLIRQKIIYDIYKVGYSYLTTNADYNTSASFFQFPLNLKLRFGKIVNIYFLAGPSINFYIGSLNKGYIRWKGNDYLGNAPASGLQSNNKIDTDFSRIEIAGNISFGIKFPVKMHEFFLELNHGQSITDVKKTPNFKNSYWNINIGIPLEAIK